MDKFQSTGVNAYAGNRPKLDFTISAGQSKMEVLVKYIDVKGVENGPFKVVFDPFKAQAEASKRHVITLKNSLLSFRDYDNKLILYFTNLLSVAKGIKEIRYSSDNNSLDKTLPFDPLKPYDSPYVILPYETQKVFCQITYKDDTKSEVIEYPKPAGLRKE